MRRIRSLVVAGLVAAVATPTTSTAQDAAAPAASAASVAPATPLRLPAALYDVVGAWDLGWGDAPGRGRPAMSGAVTAATRISGGRSSATPTGLTPAQSSFIISADSVLYRRGADWAEIAVADILSVNEVRWPDANQRGWVEVMYALRGGEGKIYFRQLNASSQATLAATFRRAIEVNRAHAETRPE